MTEPVIAQRMPYAVELKAGDYWWCRCGRSANQPFCDGSHKDTGFTPTRVSLEESGKVWLCGCKHSGNGPYCDGTHRTLE